jgi:hypothetical protein
MIKSRRIRWTEHVTRIREKRNSSMVVVIKPKRKRPLGRPRRRWVNNIRSITDLREKISGYALVSDGSG